MRQGTVCKIFVNSFLFNILLNCCKYHDSGLAASVEEAQVTGTPIEAVHQQDSVVTAQLQSPYQVTAIEVSTNATVAPDGIQEHLMVYHRVAGSDALISLPVEQVQYP